MNKPYSESCDQNRDVILSVLESLCINCNSVLEIGSGTGQHAVYFAKKMPYLKWHTSDCLPYHEGIRRWMEDSELDNVSLPIELNVTTSQWPEINIDAIFTANSIHIMHQLDVVSFFSGAGSLLPENGALIIYGPFNYRGKFTSESNERFDQWLKNRDSLSGIKHFEEIEKLANSQGLQLVNDYEMPANNRILHFTKK